MSGTAGRHSFPRGAVIGAFGVVALTILGAGISRVVGPLQSAPPPAPVVATLDLRFIDLPTGGIDVRDSHDGRLVYAIEPEKDAFIRATVRGLAQQRKREDLGDAVPFRMTGYGDGRLTLDDPATGRHIELEAFGTANAAAFAKILTAAAGR